MSERYVALLRGINVGGRNKLPMATLATTVAEAGGRRVQTYIQSGNVVFEADGDLAMPIAKGILAETTLDVPVVVRTAAQLERVIAANPYLAEGVDPRELHVGFLADRPSAADVATLDPDRSPPDRFAVVETEVYLHFPEGVARSKLTNAYFDSGLRTTITVRNWRTTTKLLELAGERR